VIILRNKKVLTEAYASARTSNNLRVTTLLYDILTNINSKSTHQNRMVLYPEAITGSPVKV